MPRTPEARARERIDARLAEAGWVVQDRAAMNLAAGAGVAVREFQTEAGPADYLLFVDETPAGVVEAKRAGVSLGSVEAQTRAYAASVPAWMPAPVRPLPFLYESTADETFFTNGLDPEPQARRVFSFHRPETLRSWLAAEIERREGRPGAPPAPTLKGRMRLARPLDPKRMWAPQVRAVEGLEASVRAGRPRALVQMATGSGKTFTAISSIYRLVKEGGARRVLFLVDRGNLGRQALKEFQAYEAPDDGRKFHELYNVVRLANNQIDPVNRVVITTIQRLYSILKGEPALEEQFEEAPGFDTSLVSEPPPVVYNAAIPPEFFDVVVIDECHRSIYTLWRQVLEYFDATLIGLTATPAKHTYAFFQRNVVSEYRHEHAVRDKVNVPYEVYEIRTRVGEGGATLRAERDAVVGKRDRQTRAVRWETLDEDVTYAASQLDRSVVAQDQLRTVIRELKEKLFTELFPGRTEIPKTLMFAKNDSHAEDILRIVREEFSVSNERAVKITYSSDRADDLIRQFQNSYDPRIAVTVDMIATGTDIKPLECVVFLRSVKSRALFEQMKGRGVRVMPDADFRAVTPDAKTKTHFVVVDCVGVLEEQKVDPPILRDRGISFEKLLERVRAGDRSEEALSTLAGRLDRMDRRLTEAQREELEAASGGVALRTLVAGLLDGLDPDREEERARARFSVESPTAEQLEAAGKELRAEAATPIAHAPALCEALLAVRRQQDQLIDATTSDEVTRSGRARQHELGYDPAKELVSEFQRFVVEHRDELDALQVLYARPYSKRLGRAQIKALADAIARPPRQWTPEALWNAYAVVERDRIRGAGSQRLWTDIVSLARHALHPETDLEPFADVVRERFEAWKLGQENRGRRFTAEQIAWLELIRDRIAADAEFRVEDFDDVPFVQHGGLGKVWALFGEELEEIVAELNVELVA